MCVNKENNAQANKISKMAQEYKRRLKPVLSLLDRSEWGVNTSITKRNITPKDFLSFDDIIVFLTQIFRRIPGI